MFKVQQNIDTYDLWVKALVNNDVIKASVADNNKITFEVFVNDNDERINLGAYLESAKIAL